MAGPATDITTPDVTMPAPASASVRAGVLAAATVSLVTLAIATFELSMADWPSGFVLLVILPLASLLFFSCGLWSASQLLHCHPLRLGIKRRLHIIADSLRAPKGSEHRGQGRLQAAQCRAAGQLQAGSVARGRGRVADRLRKQRTGRIGASPGSLAGPDRARQNGPVGGQDPPALDP